MRLSVSSNSALLVGRWRDRARKLTPALRAAEIAAMEYARERAIKYSSNTSYSVAEARKNHGPYPYAKRHGEGKGRVKGSPALPLPAYMINMQSGEFAKHWFVNTQETPQGFTSSIWNDRPYAKFMRGTSRMIVRPILSKVGEDVRKFRLVMEHNAIVKVYSGG